VIRAAAALAIAVMAGPAAGQVKCMGRPDGLLALSQTYGEAVIGYGLAKAGGAPAMAEFWANPLTGTWTLTVTLEDGRLCMIASGGEWEPVPFIPPIPAPLGEPG
jgi:hypothetical protein